MVRDGIPADRWVARAECPGGLCQVACTHILRLAQEGSAATTITRDCSGSLTRGSSRRTNLFSTTPTTATGRRWRRCVSKGRGCSSGGMAGRGRCGSEATCSSRALRRSLLRSGWGVSMGVDSQSVGGDDEDRRLLDLSEYVRHLLVVPVISPDHPDPAARCLNGPTPALSAPRAGPTASRPGPLTPPVQRPSGARADVRSSGLSLAGVNTAGSLISTGGYGNSGLTTASPSRAAISQSRWSAQTKWSMGAV